MTKLLGELNEARDPRIIITLRPQDTCPEWITHIAKLDGSSFTIGLKDQMVIPTASPKNRLSYRNDFGSKGEKQELVSMRDVNIRYGERHVSAQTTRIQMDSRLLRLRFSRI